MTGIALIGCGKWGQNYLKTIGSVPDAKLMYVCDLNPEALNLVNLISPDTKVVQDYRVVLQDPAVTAIIIATPPLTHYEIAANCMTSGKDVLVEKPITDSVDATIKLANIAKKTGLVMMTGHLMQYHPAVEKIKSYISQSSFGDIKFLTFERTNQNIFRKDIDVLGDLTVHDLAVAIYLLGQQPQWVSAHAIKMAENLPIGTVSINIGFPDNTLAHIHGNWHYHKKTRNISVIGTQGMANFDDTAEPNKKLTFISENGSVEFKEIEEKTPLYKQCEHFINCVHNKLTPRSGPEEALKVMKLMDAVILSIMKKRTVYL